MLDKPGKAGSNVRFMIERKRDHGSAGVKVGDSLKPGGGRAGSNRKLHEDVNRHYIRNNATASLQGGQPGFVI